MLLHLNTTACYLKKDDCVLMIKFSKKWGQVYAPPGGKFESGESPLDCIKREFYEETGLTLINPKLKANILIFLENGIIIGESAGSIFLQKDAKYYYDIKKGTKPKYDVELNTYECLGLIDLFIYPHFQKADETMLQRINEYEKEHNVQITRLKDGEIIIY